MYSHPVAIIKKYLSRILVTGILYMCTKIAICLKKFVRDP